MATTGEDFYSHLGSIGSFGLLVMALLTVLVGFAVRSLKGFIKEQTKPIQPTTNGGLSLPDLHAKVDAQGKALQAHIITEKAQWADILAWRDVTERALAAKGRLDAKNVAEAKTDRDDHDHG